MFFYNKEFKTPQDYLTHYHKHYGKFRVNQLSLSHSSRWYLYGTNDCAKFIKRNSYPNTREIFKDEVVIDIDADKEMAPIEKKSDALLYTRTIAGRLKRLSVSFVLWDSGGDGYHFHLKYPDIITLSKTDLERTWFKENLIKYLTKDTDRTYIDSHICHVNKTLISLELSKHRKGEYKLMKEYYDCERPNAIPPAIIRRFNEIKIKERLQAFKKYSPTKGLSTVAFKGQIPDCIKFFLERDFKDGRHRTLFLLTKFFRKRYTKIELKKFLKDWNKTVHNGHLNNTEIDNSVNYHYDSKRGPGPRYFKNLLDDIGYKYVYEKCSHCQESLNPDKVVTKDLNSKRNYK